MGWERPPPCHSKVRKRSSSAMSGTSIGPRVASSWASVTSAGWAKMNVLRQGGTVPAHIGTCVKSRNIDRQTLPLRSHGGRDSGLHLATLLGRTVWMRSRRQPIPRKPTVLLSSPDPGRHRQELADQSGRPKEETRSLWLFLRFGVVGAGSTHSIWHHRSKW